MSAIRTIPVDRITGLEQRVSVLESFGGALGHVIGEELAGGINGANKIFNTSKDFISSTTEILWNGLVVTRGIGGDYVESGNNTIVFEEAPLPGDVLRINYWKEA